MNLPNKLTILRVILIPFFVVFMLFDITGAADKWIALVIFCVASLTDMLDGKIARKYNLVTKFRQIYGSACRQAAGMYRADLSDIYEPTECHCCSGDHCQRIYHQRIPSGCF